MALAVIGVDQSDRESCQKRSGLVQNAIGAHDAVTLRMEHVQVSRRVLYLGIFAGSDPSGRASARGRSASAPASTGSTRALWATEAIIDYKIDVRGLRACGGMIWVAVKSNGGRVEVGRILAPRAPTFAFVPACADCSSISSHFRRLISIAASSGAMKDYEMSLGCMQSEDNPVAFSSDADSTASFFNSSLVIILG